jgi:cytoskeletal protein CcmA (bactofilin family)
MLKKLKKESAKLVKTGGPVGDEEKKPPPSRSIVGDAQTVIGEPFSIDGSIQGEENLILEGSMKGKVELAKHFFLVGLKGRFDGEVYARDVVVKGRLKGSIKAKGNVKITKEADFFGEVISKTISIEGGALVKGVFEIARKPPPKASDAANPAEEAGPEVSRQSATPSSQPRKGN